MTLVLEGFVTAYATSGTSIELPPIAISANAFIGLVFYLADSVQSSSVSCACGLTWQRRAAVDLGGPANTEFWYATTADPIVDDIINIGFSGETTQVKALAFTVTGIDPASPFDTNPLLPSANPSVNPFSTVFSHEFGEFRVDGFVSTTATHSMALGFYRTLTTASPRPRFGFTQLLGEDFLLAEYQLADQPLTNLLVDVTAGRTNLAAGITDAIAAAVVPDAPPRPARARVPMTGTVQYMLADFQAANGPVVQRVDAQPNEDIFAVEPSICTYEQEIGGILYRITAVEPVISGDTVTFMLRDAEQLNEPSLPWSPPESRSVPEPPSSLARTTPVRGSFSTRETIGSASGVGDATATGDVA